METKHRYATLGQAAEYVQASQDTLRRLIQRGQLRQYRLGKCIRLDLNELDLLMEVATGRDAA